MKDSSKLRSDFYTFKDTIKFYPPYINEASENFSVSKDGVLMGYGSLKGIGNAASDIVKRGPYKDVVEVAMKNKLDTTQFTSLIYSGAFDKMEPNRGVLLANAERILKYSKATNASKICNLFDPVQAFSLDYRKEFKLPTDNFMEKECYGFNIYYGFMGKNAWLVDNLLPNIIIGNIVEIKRTKTRAKQEDMAILTIETLKGKVKAILFPQVYNQFSTILAKENIFAFKGKIEASEEEVSILVSDMLTEAAITVMSVSLHHNDPINVEMFSEKLKKINPIKGICYIDVFERSGLDDEVTKVFEYGDQIYYDEKIHKFFVEMGFSIKLDLF